MEEKKSKPTNTSVQEFVGFWKRFLAYWVDGLVIGIITFPISSIFNSFTSVTYNSASQPATTTTFHSGSPIGALIAFLLGAGYFIFFWVNQNGQTLGMRLLAVRVVKEDGSPIDLSTAILRYIGYLISTVVIFLGFIWIAFDGKKQGWHDKIARTVVVKTDGKSHTGLAIAILAIFMAIFIIIFIAIVVGGLLFFNYAKSHPNAIKGYNSTSISQPTVSPVVAWENKYNYIFKSLQSDIATISKDANNKDINALSIDCKQLSTDVATAQSLPTIPDTVSASDFSSALTYFQTGSQECIDAASNLNGNEFLQVSSQLTQGLSRLTSTSNDLTAASK